MNSRPAKYWHLDFNSSTSFVVSLSLPWRSFKTHIFWNNYGKNRIKSRIQQKWHGSQWWYTGQLSGQFRATLPNHVCPYTQAYTTTCRYPGKLYFQLFLNLASHWHLCCPVMSGPHTDLTHRDSPWISWLPSSKRLWWNVDQCITILYCNLLRHLLPLLHLSLYIITFSEQQLGRGIKYGKGSCWRRCKGEALFGEGYSLRLNIHFCAHQKLHRASSIPVWTSYLSPV